MLNNWELSYFIFKIKQVLIDYTYPIFSTFTIPFYLIKNTHTHTQVILLGSTFFLLLVLEKFMLHSSSSPK